MHVAYLCCLPTLINIMHLIQINCVHDYLHRICLVSQRKMDSQVQGAHTTDNK